MGLKDNEREVSGGSAGVKPSQEADANVAAPDVVAGENREDPFAGFDRNLAMLEEEIRRNEPESDEMRRKREKRERAKKIMGAVSDGMSALANMYFTTRYAPDMQGGNSVLKSVSRGIDKAKADRDARHERYVNYSLKAGDLINSRFKTAAEQRRKDQELAMKQEAHDFDKSLWDDKRREQKGKGDLYANRAAKAGYEADVAAEDARVAPDLADERLRSQQALTGQRNAARTASLASANNSNASAEKARKEARGEYRAWDSDGNVKYFMKKDAAQSYAEQEGTYREENKPSGSSVTKNSKGKVKETTETSKVSGYPAKRSEPAKGEKGKGYGYGDKGKNDKVSKGKGY